MPLIDCDMNLSAITNDQEKSAKTGLTYLIIAFFYLLFVMRMRLNKREKHKNKD